MKTIVVTLFVFFLFSCTQDKQDDAKYISGKLTLANESDVKKEVYIYYDRYRGSKSNLLTKAEVDEDGNFKVGIPKNMNHAMIHLAAPGYESYQTRYIEGDKNPQLEATLSKRGIPQEVDSATIILIFDEQRIEKTLNVSNKEEFSLDVDFTSKEYSKYSDNDTDTIKYQIKFNADGYQTVLSGNDEWEYDHNGDYYRIAFPENDKFSINIDLNDFRKYENEEGKSLTEGNWIKSPVNKQYNEILTTVPLNEVSRLSPMYYYYVEQNNKEAIKNLSEETIEERKNETIEKFYRFLNSTDSLLNIIKSPYALDFLKCLKMDFLEVPDSAATYTDKMELLKSLNEVPSRFYSLFNNFVYTDEFKESPNEHINLLDSLYSRSKIERNYNLLKFGFYRTLARTELSKQAEISQIIKQNVNDVLESDNLDSWIEDSGPKLIAQLEIQSSEYAPDFSFKTLDGNENSLSDFRGKWVLLDFWGTWCGPCRYETPHLVKAYNKFKDKNFEIVSISSDRTVEVLEDYVNENEMNWVHTIDLKGYGEGILEQYGITSYPTIILLTPEGKIDDTDESELRGTDLIETLEDKITSSAS